MARTYKYVGPFDEVEISATGQVVKHGHQVTIDNPEIADGLDGQAAWEHIPAKRTTKQED